MINAPAVDPPPFAMIPLMTVLPELAMVKTRLVVFWDRSTFPNVRVLVDVMLLVSVRLPLLLVSVPPMLRPWLPLMVRLLSRIRLLLMERSASTAWMNAEGLLIVMLPMGKPPLDALPSCKPAAKILVVPAPETLPLRRRTPPLMVVFR